MPKYVHAIPIQYGICNTVHASKAEFCNFLFSNHVNSALPSKINLIKNKATQVYAVPWTRMMNIIINTVMTREKTTLSCWTSCKKIQSRDLG